MKLIYLQTAIVALMFFSFPAFASDREECRDAGTRFILLYAHIEKAQDDYEEHQDHDKLLRQIAVYVQLAGMSLHELALLTQAECHDLERDDDYIARGLSRLARTLGHDDLAEGVATDYLHLITL